MHYPFIIQVLSHLQIRYFTYPLLVTSLLLGWNAIHPTRSQAIAPPPLSLSSDARSPQQQARILELVTLQQQEWQQFQNFLRSPDVEEAIAQLQRDRDIIPLDELTRLQDYLRQLERPTVLFYPLILGDRLELFLLTAEGPPLRYTVPISRVELNQAIVEFRQALTNPQSEPKPAAQQLYQWLIEPLEDDLQATGATTILYAPDGVLRYVPLAALYTGEQWLTEQYTIQNITSASLTDLDTAPQQPPRILAAAHSEGRFQVPVGDRSLDLPGFLFAKDEVEAIADLIPNTTVLLNETFSPANFLPALNEYSIIHVAAHAWLFPDNPEDSFILFGNGDRISLQEIRNWNMSHVDLFVLSSCETGIGGTLGNGQEVLTLAYLLQRAGAKATLLPLWQVDDFGTKELMVSFYQALSEGMDYAEALQQAQRSLITGDPPPATRHLKGAIVEIVPGTPAHADRPMLSHPYYWAPFTLTD